LKRIIKLIAVLLLVTGMMACSEEGGPAISNHSTNSCSGFVAPTVPGTAKTVDLLIVRIQFEGSPFGPSGYSGDPFIYNHFQSNECIWANKIFGTNSGELNHYYQETSLSKFHLVPATESFGEANDGVITVTVKGNHPNPGSQGAFQSVLVQSLQLADPYIDFSSFDASGDGDLNRDDLQVMFLVAGYESAAGGTPGVWAHAFCLDANLTREGVPPPILDGTTLLGCTSTDGTTGNGYSRFGERYSDGSDMSIGVIAHELGHSTSMALPDLYDILGNTMGIGSFGLMGAGSWASKNDTEIPGTTPVPLSAWSKTKIGWMTPMDVTVDTAGLTLVANDQAGRNLLKVAMDSEEYFLVENLGITGYNEGYYNLDKTTFSGGVAIWHIDEGQTDCVVWPQVGITSTCQGWLTNADGSHKAIDLEEADSIGLDARAHSGRSLNLFNSGGVSEFTDNTTTNSKDYNDAITGIEIRVTTLVGADATVDIINP